MEFFPLSFILSIAKDGEIQNLALHYMEQVDNMKYGDIYTDFAGQSDIFINNIDHIVISESTNPNSVVRDLFLIYRSMIMTSLT